MAPIGAIIINLFGHSPVSGPSEILDEVVEGGHVECPVGSRGSVG